jgi:hypothetical protein
MDICADGWQPPSASFAGSFDVISSLNQTIEAREYIVERIPRI